MNAEQPDDSPLTDAEIAEFLKRPTSLREGISAHVRGFSTEEMAREVGNALFAYLRILGVSLNIEKLEKVTIAYDYLAACAEVDRGVPGMATLKPTKDEVAVGVAMAATFKGRDGKPYTHLVVHGGVMYALVQGTDQEQSFAFGMLAHEAAHVHDLAMKEKMFPGLFGSPIPDTREGWLSQIAHPCWDEYVACRLSARYAKNDTHIFEDVFCAALEKSREEGNNLIWGYRFHGDIERLVGELRSRFGSLLIYASYLWGHIHGLKGDCEALAPKAFATMQEHEYFKVFWSRLGIALGKMYETYPGWTTLEVYRPLKQLGERLLEDVGMVIEPRGDGNYYVRVPFTDENPDPAWSLGIR